MIQVFGNLKGLLKSKRICIDYVLFRLHYHCTTLVLLVFCVVVTTKQYGGEPIKCTKQGERYSEVADAYCLVTSTFTVRSAYNASMTGLPYPGIMQTDEKGNDIHYHTYYQYVGFILFFQAAFFYLPHWLWKTLEGNKIEFLVRGIDEKYVERKDISAQKDLVLNYLANSWGSYNGYALKYFFCEFLCFFNVIMQMYALDKLFDGKFMTFGFDFVRYVNEPRVDEINPGVKIFPRVTSCSFRFFGTSGKIATVHLLCVLAINVINEKIFVIMWFWFIILATLGSLSLFFRLVIYLIPPVRRMMLQSRHRHMKAANVRVLMERGGLGDWFVLHLIRENVDDFHFLSLVSDLAGKLGCEKDV